MCAGEKVDHRWAKGGLLLLQAKSWSQKSFDLGCPCVQVTLNDTHVFLADGYSLFAYILNWDEESWEIQVRKLWLYDNPA